MPNMDPRMLKRMMDSMGIKNIPVDAVRVIVECNDKDIIIDGPEVSIIEAQGSKTFQVSGGIISEKDKSKPEINNEDIKLVMEQTGVNDEEKARAALESSNGDMAQAILKLKNENENA